jgi:hypothetical protein
VIECKSPCLGLPPPATAAAAATAAETADALETSAAA